jgi:beta-galactosidase
LGTYDDDFYAHRPAVTVNHVHDGHAYYVGARTKQDFIDDFVSFLLQRHSVVRHLNAQLPEAVSVSIRTNGQDHFIFLMNFSQKSQSISSEHLYGRELFTSKAIKGMINLEPFGVAVVQQI